MSGVNKLKRSPNCGHDMSDERRQNMRNGFVEQRYNRHPEHPELERYKNNVLPYGISQAATIMSRVLDGDHNTYIDNG
jgi:hypothetical protein